MPIPAWPFTLWSVPTQSIQISVTLWSPGSCWYTQTAAIYNDYLQIPIDAHYLGSLSVKNKCSMASIGTVSINLSVIWNYRQIPEMILALLWKYTMAVLGSSFRTRKKWICPDHQIGRKPQNFLFFFEELHLTWS